MPFAKTPWKPCDKGNRVSLVLPLGFARVPGFVLTNRHLLTHTPASMLHLAGLTMYHQWSTMTMVGEG